MLQGVEIEVLVAHCNRYVGGYLTFIYERKEVVEGIPIAADLGPWSKGVEPLLEEGHLLRRRPLGEAGQIAEDQTVRALDGL